MCRRIFVGVRTAVMLCVLSGALRAQSGTSITGTVTDRQGGVVPGVAVTLTNQAAGLTRTAATDGAGVYSFLQLVPGRYSVRAELQGYKTIVAEEIELLINTSARVNLRFNETGSAGEIVRLKGAATLNAQDATVGHAFNDVQVKELPMEGRNVAGLFSLQPGVTFIGANSTDARNGAVNGGKSDQANVTLDGADVNDQQNGYAFTSVLRVTLDSVQEFRVTTTGMNADQGRSSGAQISLVTRSGTNKYHGSLYEYHRNTITSANDFFLKTSQLSQGQPNQAPKLLRNIFGGSIGGPVLKDRVFLFFNYEGRRDASATTVNRSVPSMDMRNGIVHYQTLSGGTATLTPVDIRRIDPLHIGPSPATLAYMQQYPVPNNTSAGDGLNVVGYRFASPIHLKYDTYISRIDYHITRDGRHVMFWRGNLQNDHSTEAQQFPGRPPNFVDLNNTKGFAASYKALFTNKLVNSVTWGYTRSAVEQDAVMNTPYVALRTLTALNADSGYSNGRTIPVHNVTDDLTWQKGSHALQFGVTLRWIRNGSFTYSGSFPSASTTNSWLAGTGRELQATLPDLLGSYSIPYIQAMTNVLGIITQGYAKYLYDRTGALLPVGSPKLRNYAADEYQGYAQDAWRARPNLTLTFGLRWGIYSPPWETNGLQVAPTPSLNDWFNLRGTNMLKGIPSNQAPKIQVDLAGSANGKLGYYPWQTINPAPRVAFAWSPAWKEGLLKKLTGGPGRFVVRGGFGLAYDRIGGGLATTFDAAGSFGLSASISNPAHSLDVSTAPRYAGEFNVPAALLPPGPRGQFPATPPSVQAISFGMDDHITMPYQYLLNFTVQRQLPHGFSIEAAYIGRMAHHLLVQGDLAMPENLKDTASGMDYFTAAGILGRAALANTPVSQVARVPYWENLYPGLAAGTLSATQAVYNKIKANSPSWLDGLWDLDVTCGASCSKFGPFAFFNDQYSALAGWRSLGWSNYQAAQLLVRKRFSAGMQFDFNYTFGKSFDISSAVERAGAFPSTFLHNGWDPNANKSVSDFDTRHSVNANFIAELPFGKNRLLFAHAGRFADGIIGGWQVSSIFRWTSGFPAGVGEGNYYPTNWETTGWATRIGDSPKTRTTKNARNSAGSSGPNLFEDPAAAIKAYQFTLPGYVGTRNDLRGDGFFGIDMGVSKSWKMPYAEGHRVQFRWEAFNVTNTVRFDVSSLNMNLANPGIFGQYSVMLNSPRVMQFSLRYEF